MGSFNEEYQKLRKKRLEEQEEIKSSVPYQRQLDTSAPVNSPTYAERVLSGDIAPVKTTTEKEEKEQKWFDSGAFDDGYQFGDITKTILGTVRDVRENFATGVVGLGEKVVDALVTIAPYIAQGQYYANGGGFNIQADQAFNQAMDVAKKENAELVKKDLYNEEDIAKTIIAGLNPQDKLLGITADDSISGEKLDSLVQSGGEMAVSAALGPYWWLVTGASALGSEAESALNSGASLEEAAFSGMISAGAEIATEKIFGAIKFGGKSLEDILGNKVSKALANNISNKTARTLVKMGYDAAGEGFEEVLSGTLSAMGKQLSYSDEKEIKKFFESGEAWDSFVGGAAMGGVMSGGKAALGGTDITTGLTKNEQAVADAEIKNRIVEREADGTKLTNAQKSEIRKQVYKDLEKGYISTDTIEEVLGGEDYTNYKNELKRQQDIDNELNELRNMKSGEMTDIQIERMAELKGMTPNTEMTNALKFSIDEKIRNALSSERNGKGSYLFESYNEQTRRGQAFEADLSKYDGKQAEVIKKAIDSGILNNTNRTHDFVDMVAKISADKGVLFDFANNAKLKESGFAVDGKFVNGYVTKDGITVNIDSNKALNSIVGHEITHVLEGTELYAALKVSITEYAKSKGDYQSRIDTLTKLYEGVEGADVSAELTADLVGDYLFTDEDFINHLSTSNRNVFQKIYDEIKYLYKIATAGSKQARELEKVKRAFDKAYRESGKASGDTKYSLSEQKTPTYKELVAKKPTKIVKITEGIESGSYADMKATTMSKAKNEGWFDAPHHNEDTDSQIFLTEKSFTHAYSNLNAEFGEDTIRCMAHIPEIIKEAVLVSVDDPRNNRKAETKVYTFFGAVEGANGIEPVKLTVKEFDFKSLKDVPKNIRAYFENNGIEEKYNSLYDARALEVIGIEGIKKESDASVKVGAQGARAQDTSDSTISIADLLKLVKGDAEKYIPKFSLSDSDGKKLTKEQSEYFKDSKMRDDNGNLKVMYHGSQDAGFHTFDANMSDDDTSFFFVDRNDVAASYSGTSETYAPKAFKTVEDANKFFAEINATEYAVIENNGKYTLLEDGDEIATSDDLAEIYEEWRDWSGLGYGDANYKVYLNLTNPLEIDAEGRNWNNISREYSQEVADRYHSLTAEEKAALTNLAEWGEYGIFKDEMLEAMKKGITVFPANSPLSSYEPKIDENVRLLSSAYKKLGGATANLYDAFSIASENFSEESIKQFAVKQMNTRDYAQKAKAEGYDGVIFKNIHDNGGYSNGDEGASTVAIAFNSNQIKSVANDKPTKQADIRYSLSEPQADNDYLSAVERGDTETVAKMVEEAAEQSMPNSKVRDDNGNLRLVYHGRVSDFNIFDRQFSNIEGDFGKGFYFTSNEYDVDANYANEEGPDLKNKIARYTEQLEYQDGYEELTYEEREKIARDRFITSEPNTITAYLNMENPVYITPNEKGTFLDFNEEYDEEFDEYGEPEGLFIDFVEALTDNAAKFNTSSRGVDFNFLFEHAIDNGGMYAADAVKVIKDNIYADEVWDDKDDGAINEVIRLAFEDIGFDGIIDSSVYYKFRNMSGMDSGTTHYIVFNSNQIKSADLTTYDDNGNVIPLSERFNSNNNDIRYSLSDTNEAPKKTYGNYNVYGKDIRLPGADDIAPVGVAENAITTEDNSVDMGDEFAPVINSYTIEQEIDEIGREIEALVEESTDLYNKGEEAKTMELLERINELSAKDRQLREQVETLKAQEEAERKAYMDSLADAEPPVETERAYSEADRTPLDEKTLKTLTKGVRDVLSCMPKESKAIREVIEKYSTSDQTKSQLFRELKEKFGDKYEYHRYSDIAEAKKVLRTYKFNVSDQVKGDIADFRDYKKSHNVRTSKNALSVDVLYEELSGLYPEFFPADITNETDRFERISEVSVMPAAEWVKVAELSDNEIMQAADFIHNSVTEYRNNAARKAAEANARAYIDDIAPSRASEITKIASDPTLNYQGVHRETPIKTTREKIAEQIENFKQDIANLKRNRADSIVRFNRDIARLQDEYNAKANKNTKVANNILIQIENLQTNKNNVDAMYEQKISNLETKVEKMSTETYQTAKQRQSKTQEYAEWAKNLIGDTTHWVDKKLGISYKVNTLKRNLRDVVRDAQGNRDIEKADAIYDELQGTYNHNEAELNRESNRIKKVFADMKITSAEDAYIQMLGEFMYNPDTTLTPDDVNNYYEAHKSKIDKDKVNEAIKLARANYDSLLERVNEVLREQGMKEIPYRKGYFPHFTETKQSWLAKLFNWKTQDTEIPTSIAGLTEQFTPNRSWQSFNKQRFTDATDYSFTKGFDTYVQGALDWIYHIEDIQKRRAFENELRYIHSEKGIQDKVEALFNNEEYDADELQEQIDLVYEEARNPLNNFVTDLHAGTNKLASKKSSMDRGMEELTNRKFYSTMTNLSNRVSANMVGGSVSSALTNFIPITQSWGEVSPVSSLRAMGETIRATFKDDGVIDKSDFLTNRLKKSENLYKTTWDKITDKAAFMMEGIDFFTSQTVWRSRYLENIANGMSESEAIKNADQFAEGVMAGRSRGNQPTLFDSKNPLIKTLTAFQLEVNNQYGYMFKDMPQDMKNESTAKLVKGYAAIFVGAYAYNALYSTLTGRDAAFDPIRIVQELLGDLFDEDEEEEPIDAVLGFAENVVQELPFVGGLLGGGRVPISSALPYDGNVMDLLEGTANAFAGEDVKTATKEWLRPLYYLAMPMGGGQLKKTIEGLSMFSEDHPIAGSYTDSGKLRFPVDDTLANRVQAGIFGQYASQNARDYFDNDIAPLNEKQTQEFIDVDMDIHDYWDYREGLSKYKTLAEKADYINSLDLTADQKNVLINNIADRKEDIDMSDYDNYDSFEEFDYANKYPEKYEFWKQNGISYEDYVSGDDDTKAAYNWAYENPDKFTLSKAVASDVVTYRQYTKELYDIKADKDSDGKSITGSRKEKVIKYINNLDADYGSKIILFKSEYPADDTYNVEIVNYLNSREDISYKEMETILKELGFNVDSNGRITWD